jgi:hypothetical protein
MMPLRSASQRAYVTVDMQMKPGVLHWPGAVMGTTSRGAAVVVLGVTVLQASTKRRGIEICIFGVRWVRVWLFIVFRLEFLVSFVLFCFLGWWQYTIVRWKCGAIDAFFLMAIL